MGGSGGKWELNSSTGQAAIRPSPPAFCPNHACLRAADARHALFRHVRGIIAQAVCRMKQVVHAACPHDCPDACAVLITIEDGRATRIQGDPEHPVTRGFLCGKVAKYLDRVYSPDRVLFPVRRIAPKGTHGEAVFQRISWNEALDEIVARLKRISTEFGPEAVLPYSYGGNI